MSHLNEYMAMIDTEISDIDLLMKQLASIGKNAQGDQLKTDALNSRAELLILLSHLVGVKKILQQAKLNDVLEPEVDVMAGDLIGLAEVAVADYREALENASA